MNNSRLSAGRGARGWLLQRLSALALLLLLTAHLWIEHFLHPGRRITYHSVAARLLHGLYQGIDYALLVIVVYHALNGLMNVLRDRVRSAAGWVAITATFWVVGLATVVLGADILSAFLNGRAWFYL